MDTIEAFDKKQLTALIAGIISAVDYADGPNDPVDILGPVATARRIVEAVFEEDE